jgi:hypothetical protein
LKWKNYGIKIDKENENHPEGGNSKGQRIKIFGKFKTSKPSMT